MAGSLSTLVGVTGLVGAGVACYFLRKQSKVEPEKRKIQKDEPSRPQTIRLRGAGTEEQTAADAKMDAGTPTLKSFIIYFLPLSPMNPSLPFWIVGILPAVLYYFGIGVAPMRYWLLGAPCADASLDMRPLWLQALECGERTVVAVIHLFVAMLHVNIAAGFKSEGGAAALAQARELAFTDAPKGSAAMDAFQWPPGPYIAQPVWYMRFHTLIDLMPLPFFLMNMPDLVGDRRSNASGPEHVLVRLCSRPVCVPPLEQAYMAMLVEKAGGNVDHLYCYGGPFMCAPARAPVCSAHIAPCCAEQCRGLRAHRSVLRGAMSRSTARRARAGRAAPPVVRRSACLSPIACAAHVRRSARTVWHRSGSERLKTLFPIMIAISLRLTLLMVCRCQPSTYGFPDSLALDAAAHVAGAHVVGLLMRLVGWSVCGVRPAARLRPGRAQTPYKKAE
jgi:hypothetical protein